MAATVIPAPVTSSDSWYNVTDPKERKKIQDRLAQRARRRRLANTGTSNKTSRQTSTLSGPGTVKRRSIASPDAPLGVTQTIFTALLQNGMILGLKCGLSVPAKSAASDEHVPYTLRPTLLQRSTIHFMWIDRYPLEDCRDHLIIGSAEFDEEEFLGDLFSMPSFTIEPGCASWDPRGWRMEPEWDKKWGWVFPSFARALTPDDSMDGFYGVL